MYMVHLAKILDAVGLLASAGGSTIQRMEEALGVSRRTVYRVLETLQASGVPIYEEPNPAGRGKVWKLEERYVRRLPNMDVPVVRLTEEERLLLAFLLAGAGAIHRTGLEARARTLREKVRLALDLPDCSPSAATGLASVFLRSTRGVKQYQGKEDLIEALADAIVARTTCDVTYYTPSNGLVRDFPIDPLQLLEHRGGLYLFVRMSRHGQIRILAVDRIRSLARTEARFERPADFDPEALLDTAFDLTFGDPISARIWFSPRAAPYVKERRWAQEQTIEDRPDGSIVLELQTSGSADLRRWVLSYGSDAVVLHPHELAQEIQDEACKVAAAYGRSDAKAP